jgi:hypothetical protein
VLGEPAEAQAAPFRLRTPHGDLHVDTTAAELALVPSTLISRMEDREVAFLRRHGFDAVRRATTGFDEILIVPGATITVRGLVRIEVDPASSAERGYRDELPQLARLESIRVLDAW